MNSGDNNVGMSLRQSFANSIGKYSSLFMSREQAQKNPSRINLEDSVRMEGYDVNVSKPVKNRTDMFQPVAGNSDFWLS